MEVWRRGREFLRMLDRKQQVLQGDIVKTTNRITQVKLQLTQYQQQLADINQQIKMLTPTGMLSREDIYIGIRAQGALLSRQQLVFHEISSLESEESNLVQKNQQQRLSLSLLDKKHYKIDSYLQSLRIGYIRRRDNAAEREVQEVASYGRKCV